MGEREMLAAASIITVMLVRPLAVAAQLLAIKRMTAGAEVAQKIAHGLVQRRIVGDFVMKALELADADRGHAAIEKDLGGSCRHTVFAQGHDLRAAAAAGVIIGSDAMTMRITFLDQRPGCCERHDPVMAAGRSP